MLKTKTVLELTIGGMLLLAAPDLRAQSLKAVPIQETGVNVALGDITDSRTNGKFFQYLRIELKLSGSAIETAFGATKPVITEAVDDTGRSLVKSDERKDALFWTLQLNESKKTSLEQTTDLINPARRATTISMIGYRCADAASGPGLGLYDQELSGSGWAVASAERRGQARRRDHRVDEASR